MAMMIVAADCTACGSCEFVCPSKAIREKGDVFAINPEKCTECAGVHDSPACVDECPADAIIKLAA